MGLWPQGRDAGCQGIVNVRCGLVAGEPIVERGAALQVFLGFPFMGAPRSVAEAVALVRAPAVIVAHLADESAGELEVRTVGGGDGRVIGVTRCARCA